MATQPADARAQPPAAEPALMDESGNSSPKRGREAAQPNQSRKQKLPEKPLPAIEEDNDDDDFESDTNKIINVKQQGDANGERHDIRDTDMGAAITYLLMALDGVDTEPDILDVSKKGPWLVYCNEDCATQFEDKHGKVVTLNMEGVAITFTIEYEDVPILGANKDKRAGSSSRAVANVLSDAATHVVIRINDRALGNRITLNDLKKGVESANLRYLKGNREKRKINTAEGLIGTSGKKFIWHLYLTPADGTNAFGFPWPKSFIIVIDGITYIIEYAIRESGELGGKNDELVVHYGMRGCKAYNAKAAAELKAKGIHARTCTCDAQKAQAEARKVRRIEHGKVDLRAALGAPPPSDCSRFVKGICLLNKKGKKCSGNHHIPGLWDTTEGGSPFCVVECKLKAHPHIAGLCINGKECLYAHPKKETAAAPPAGGGKATAPPAGGGKAKSYAAAAKKCAPLHSKRPAPAMCYPLLILAFVAGSRAITYAETFNATLGYPGEGPFSIATYNIDGTRDTLGPVLAQAKQAKIDILLLQELHFYDKGEHLSIGATADRLGWTLVHSPATRSDPASGVAIAVWQESRSVKPIVASARSLIPGRYITMSCNILGTTQDVSSVYLSAQPKERKEHLHIIEKSKIFKEHAIIGGDFNCVENTDLDVLYPVEGRRTTYGNASGKALSRLVAECGLLDAYRLLHGNETRKGHTRKADTVHTRIDRIYTQAYDSKWRWHQISPSTTAFTGKAKSDHLPVVAKIALAKERPPSQADMKINPAIFDSPNTRFITELIWKRQIAKYPPETHGHAKGWTAAKEAVATYLLYETSERRLKKSPISKLKKKIEITHCALDAAGPNPALTEKIDALHAEIEEARKTHTHSTRSARDQTTKEEMLTKEFFTTFRSRTNNGDIAEIYRTASWDNPDHREDNTTEKDHEILRELRKYYVWLYGEKPSIENEVPLRTLRERPLQQSDIDLMERPVTLYECKQAIRRLGLGKAAGPDGLTAEFYRSFEGLIVHSLHSTLLEAHAGGALPPTMREGDVVLLYKKGDSRDPRNYRPITLLQVDYKILAKILVARMRKVVNNFVSKEQLGFVPKRLIGEATHLLKLTQAYLEEEGRDGLLLALDWEKAFDRVSWEYYHLALEALNFGPAFRGWARLLANPDAPPTRRIKANGKRSNPFSIHSGVPQGCPLSPLAFLVVAEALTRLIQADPEIKGIEINGVHIKINQFADDTQLFSEGYEDLARSLRWVKVYEKATGGKVNAHKYVGIQWGTQKRKTIPEEFLLFNWLQKGQYTKILGAPFWSSGENDSFWEALYLKIKRRISNWKRLKLLSIIGRATLANFMIYSVPRYWVQTIAAPKWFHKYLEADVYQLLWERDPSFDVEEIGTDTHARKWLKHHTAPITPKRGVSLGVGLIDWESHVKAMQVKWLLKYLDASDSTWKTVLDCWFARTSLGRAAITSTIPIKTLTKSMRGNIALPAFWRQALAALRELPVAQTQLSHSGALSQPIWDNIHYPPPRIPPVLRDRWEALETTVVHNTYTDLEGTTHFTKEDTSEYICNELDHHYFQGKKINNEKFLNTWDTITNHCDTQMVPFEPDPQVRPRARSDHEHVAITIEGEYILFKEGKPFKGVQNTLGELAWGEEILLDPEHLDLDPSPPARWGNGYKGPAREAYPLPKEYTLDPLEHTPLDETSVKILTSLFTEKCGHKAHPCIGAWEKRLGITDAQWKIIASRYNTTLLTPRDYHLHFKHITHRRIATNNRFAEQPILCRFCQRYDETSVHLGRCPGIHLIFKCLNDIAQFSPPKNRTYRQKALDTLFGHPHPQTPSCVGHLHMIAWRYILTDFYQIHFDETTPPFNIDRALHITKRTLERYTLLVMAKAHRTRTLTLTRQRKDNTPSTRLVRRTRAMIGPLFELDEEARLSMSDRLAAELKSGDLEHVGKHLPRFPSD